MEHNTAFITESTASAAPRQYILREPTTAYVGTLSIALGISDALLAVLPHTPADSYVLLLFAIVLGRGNVRLLGVAAMIYCVVQYPVPLAHEMLRCMCFALPLLCANMDLSVVPTMLRIIASAVTAISYASGPCTSILRAIPPASVVHTLLFVIGANLPLTFIITALFL